MNIRPNLEQIDQISGNNQAFRERLINVIKKELPEEIETYRKNLASKNYFECSENVHKLKHKISILSLEEPYLFAISYEEELKEANTSKSVVFDKIIAEMLCFIQNL